MLIKTTKHQIRSREKKPRPEQERCTQRCGTRCSGGGVWTKMYTTCCPSNGCTNTDPINITFFIKVAQHASIDDNNIMKLYRVSELTGRTRSRELPISYERYVQFMLSKEEIQDALPELDEEQQLFLMKGIVNEELEMIQPINAS